MEILGTYKKPANLLSKGDTNAKTSKNELSTLILYLAPLAQNSQGRNLCPKASKGCAAACLFTAGRGRFNSVQASRINRTEYFLSARLEFLEQSAKEINAAAKKAEKVAVRLNGTSDLRLVEMLTERHNIAENVIFYDYTKILSKAVKYAGQSLPSGHRYVVTFSRAENNEAESLEALKAGANVAAVFKNELPKIWAGAQVVDGDSSDIVMLEHSGKVLGLKAKGEAKKDTSGFVIA
jgi:hypothetical protein